MRALALLILGALAVSGETIITFAPQGAITGRVDLWTASACAPKAISITTIYALAVHRGIAPLMPATAERLFQKKSAWSRIVRVAGFAAAGGGALMTFDVVKASTQVQTSMLIGGALISVLLPLAEKEIPRADPAVGRSLMLDVDGCGVAQFYAAPSSVAGFNEVLP